MKLGLKILLILLAIIIIIGLFFYLSLTKSSTTPAFLYIEQGIVEVDKGNGYEKAVDEMELKSDYKVRTLNGKASVVFYESEVLQLEENTEIKIDELKNEKVSIKQELGQTWNGVSKLTGKRDYSLKTPKSVATIRDTQYGIKSNNEDTLLVGEGIVKLCNINNNCNEFKFLEKGIVKNNTIEKAQLTKEDISYIKSKILKNIEILKKVRLREINKNKITLSIIKKSYEFTDEQFINYLSEIDQGLHNLDELAEKSPIKSESLNKTKKLSEEIIRLNQHLNKI